MVLLIKPITFEILYKVILLLIVLTSEMLNYD